MLKSHGTEDSISIKNYVKKGKKITIIKANGCELTTDVIIEDNRYLIYFKN
jgi:hypothetical protein